MLVESAVTPVLSADPRLVQHAWRRQWSRLGFAYHHLLGAQTVLATHHPIGTERWAGLLCLLFEARDQGHLCLPLHQLKTAWDIHPGAEQFPQDWPTEGQELAHDLVASGLAGTTVDQVISRPLVISNLGQEPMLYFRGMYLAESNLLVWLAHHHRQPSTPAPGLLHQNLDGWFKQLPSQLCPETRQAQAIHLALDQRLFILGGGPGTGKTTTVFHILHGLFLMGHTSLALAAPTGRAAARLQESLARSLNELATWLLTEQDQAFASWLGGARGMTLHRLLGQSGVFSEYEPDLAPLPFDLIVVDEASMIDLDQMLLLLKRLPVTARLILVGDQNQLPSVGAGSILADLAESGRFLASCQLEYCFRSDTAILEIANTILAGRIPDLALIGSASVRNYQLAGGYQAPGQRAALIARWAEEQGIAILARACHLADPVSPGLPARLYADASRSILLTPMRDGPWGVQALNIQVRELMPNSGKTADVWCPGMMAMVTRNDYERGLYNGDRGLVFRVGVRLMVWFPAAMGTANEGRWFSPYTIPGLEPAWAQTVHKSQGSEYETVWMFLGESISTEAQVSRELLYTGMTRARKQLVLAVNPAALAAACGQAVQRHSGIVPRIRAMPVEGP